MEKKKLILGEKRKIIHRGANKGTALGEILYILFLVFLIFHISTIKNEMYAQKYIPIYIFNKANNFTANEIFLEFIELGHSK